MKSAEEDKYKGNLPALLQGSWLWFVLPGLATFVLNAVTTYLSADVMPLPMLWVILLAAFLLSFVAGFSKPGEVALPLWCIFAVLSAGFLLFAYWKGSTTDFLINMGAGTLVYLLRLLFSDKLAFTVSVRRPAVFHGSILDLPWVAPQVA